MALEESRIVKKLSGHQVLVEGKWVDTTDDIGESVTVEDGWIFRYRRLRKLEGRCSSKKRTIEIKTGLQSDALKGALLHEMIHAYEAMLPQPFRDWLLLDLHKRLVKRIGPRLLDRYINLNTHTVLLLRDHGLLFLLKSLQLDERLGWKRGTVFGYGREGILR